MITMPFMMGARAKEEVWEITVNTEATRTGAKTTGIPISLYNQPGITVSVDWGDGTNSVLTQASYTEGGYTPSTHEYANPGTYTVQIKSTKWKDLNIDVYGLSSPATPTTAQQIRSSQSAAFIGCHLDAFRNTLIGVGQLPGVNGIQPSPGEFRYNTFIFLFYRCTSLTSIPADLFTNNTLVTTFSSCFRDCSSLTSIPANLFASDPAVTNFDHCFRGCTSLTSIPAGLFDNNTAVKTFSRCFYSCANITDFSLRVTSPLVINASSFVSIKSGTTRTIYVPSGSITETTFNSVAANLGLTIIGE